MLQHLLNLTVLHLFATSLFKSASLISWIIVIVTNATCLAFLKILWLLPYLHLPFILSLSKKFYYRNCVGVEGIKAAGLRFLLITREMLLGSGKEGRQSGLMFLKM